MIPAIKPKHAMMREAALRGFSTATDLADYGPSWSAVP